MPYKNTEDRRACARRARARNIDKVREYQRIHKAAERAKNPAIARTKHQQWADKNRENLRARQRAWAKANPRSGRSLAWQEKRAGRVRPTHCEVCGQPEQAKGRGLSFDHDHATGKFRGWLCSGCNCSLGYAKDSPVVLRKLADYLENAANAAPTI